MKTKFLFRPISCIEPLEARISPAVLLVTTFADSGDGSLRDAIDHANSSPGEDTITFKSGGSIKLMTALPSITDDLLISASKTVTINGQGKVQLLQITGNGTDVTLDGLKLTGGVAEQGGALLINALNGHILIKNSKLTGNKAISFGGGAVSGGAIANLQGNLAIESSQLSGNSAWSASEDATSAYGGAILNLGSLTISSPTKGTIISGNFVSAQEASGGAIFNGEGATASLDHVILSGNKALGSTGTKGADGLKGVNGANSSNPGEAGEDGEHGGDGDFGGGGGEASGGAIENLGTFELKTSKVTGNTAFGGNGGVGGNGGAGGNGGKGGAAYNSNGYHYSGGTRGAGGDGGYAGSGGYGGNAFGGAIDSEKGLMTITDTLISGNSAKNGIGGVGGKGAAGGTGSTHGQKSSPGMHGEASLYVSGGGIQNSGTLLIDHSTISKNNVVVAGVSYVSSGGSDSVVPSGGSGGGICNDGTLTLTNSAVSFNKVKAANGANGLSGLKGFNGSDGFDGADGGNGSNAIPGGSACGGGIFNSGTGTIQTSTISGNTVTSGNGGNGGKGGAGGGAGSGSYVGNGGNGGYGGNAGKGGNAEGGGIYSSGSYLTSLIVQDSTISGNSAKAGVSGSAGAGGKGGSGYYSGTDGADGIAVGASHGDGGGIFSSDILKLSQVTIAKNVASGNGGGVLMTALATNFIHNSTIASNRASAGGGLFAVSLSADSVAVVSSIIASNSGNNNAPLEKDVSGPVNASFSLIGGDPLLSSLAFHGGSTQVMLPLLHSPAINAGSNPDGHTLDQRGVGVDKLGNPVLFTRVLDSQIDIGAVEFPSTVIANNSAVPGNDVSGRATTSSSLVIVQEIAYATPISELMAVSISDIQPISSSGSFTTGCVITLSQPTFSTGIAAMIAKSLSQIGTTQLALSDSNAVAPGISADDHYSEHYAAITGLETPVHNG